MERREKILLVSILRESKKCQDWDCDVVCDFVCVCVCAWNGNEDIHDNTQGPYDFAWIQIVCQRMMKVEVKQLFLIKVKLRPINYSWTSD